MGDVGQGKLHKGDQHGAQNGPEKMADPADIGHHQHITGGYVPDRLRRYDFIVYGKEPPGDTGKKSGKVY
jgi:hypothetical protein